MFLPLKPKGNCWRARRATSARAWATLSPTKEPPAAYWTSATTPPPRAPTAAAPPGTPGGRRRRTARARPSLARRPPHREKPSRRSRRRLWRRGTPRTSTPIRPPVSFLTYCILLLKTQRDCQINTIGTSRQVNQASVKSNHIPRDA